MPPKRKAKATTSTKPPRASKNRRTAATATVRPTLEETASKLQESSTNSADPLARLDDLCLNLVFRHFSMVDLFNVSGVSQLWKARSLCWLRQSPTRRRELGILSPDSAEYQDPEEYARAWRSDALTRILREQGKPTKVVKIPSVARDIWDTAGGYIAWISSEQMRYQWGEEYVGGTDHYDDPGTKYFGFKESWLNVQRIINPQNPDAKIQTSKRTNFQKLIPVKLRSGLKGHYYPTGLKLWASKDNSRLIGMLDVAAAELFGESIMTLRGTRKIPRNRKGQKLTLAIDMMTLRVLWGFDHLEDLAEEEAMSGISHAVSRSGQYAILRGITYKNEDDHRRRKLHLRTFDLVTGSLLRTLEILDGEELFSLPWLSIHPTLDLTFLGLKHGMGTMVTVVTPTGHYKLPPLPKIINHPLPGGIQSDHGYDFDEIPPIVFTNQDTFDISVSVHVERFSQSPVRMAFSYALPENPETTTAWNPELTRIRRYIIPDASTNRRVQSNYRHLNLQLNQLLVEFYGSPYGLYSDEDPTLEIINFIEHTDSVANTEYAVRINSPVPVEYYKGDTANAVRIKTRPKTRGGEGNTISTGFKWKSRDITAKVTEHWMTVSGEDTLIAAFYGAGCCGV